LTMEALTPRQKEILARLIESHIATTTPVGSRTLAERHGLNLSPASVRNEMGILEEKGYLTHRHTSAGRLPTDQGYQFYVREVVREEPVSSESLNQIVQEMEQKIDDLENLMERVSSILSGRVKETALVMTPARLHVEGSRYIVAQPEFRDLEKLQLLMETLEEKSRLIHLLMDRPPQGGVRVAIGEKELSKDIWDCALVSIPYEWGGKPVGVLGVLGPRRMPYGRIIGLVHQVAEKLGEVLARRGPA